MSQARLHWGCRNERLSRLSRPEPPFKGVGSGQDRISVCTVLGLSWFLVGTGQHFVLSRRQIRTSSGQDV